MADVICISLKTPKGASVSSPGSYKGTPSRYILQKIFVPMKFDGLTNKIVDVLPETSQPHPERGRISCTHHGVLNDKPFMPVLRHSKRKSGSVGPAKLIAHPPQVGGREVREKNCDMYYLTKGYLTHFDEAHFRTICNLFTRSFPGKRRELSYA